MSNITKETLAAGAKIRAAGAKFLLIRDATNTMMLRVDTNEPVEIKKNDVIVIQGCNMVEIANHHESALTVEYQITDLAINTQSDAVSLAGAVRVDEIEKPVTVSGIQDTVDVRLGQGVEVTNLPATQKVEVTNPVDVQKVEIQNHQAVEFPETQQVSQKSTDCRELDAVTFGASGLASIAASADRKCIIIQAHEDNAGVCLIQGLRLMAGGVLTLPAANELTLSGVEGDILQLVEVV